MVLDWCIEDAERRLEFSPDSKDLSLKNPATAEFYVENIIAEANSLIRRSDSQEKIRQFLTNARDYWLENIQAQPVTSFQKTPKIGAILDPTIQATIDQIIPSEIVLYAGCGKDFRSTLAQLVAGENVVDIGTGSGYMLPFLKAAKVRGVEPQYGRIPGLEKIVNILKSKGVNIKIRKCTVGEYVRNPADTAIISHGEYFKPEETAPHLEKIATQRIIVGVACYFSPIRVYGGRNMSINIGNHEMPVRNYKPLRWLRALGPN